MHMNRIAAYRVNYSRKREHKVHTYVRVIHSARLSRESPYLLLVEDAAGVDVDRVLVLDGLVVARLGHLGGVVEKPGRHRLFRVFEGEASRESVAVGRGGGSVL